MNAQPLALRLAAEALGTFLFLFLGFNAIAVATDVAGGSISPLGVAFAFGLGLTLAITALGHVSGGHFNPAAKIARGELMGISTTPRVSHPEASNRDADRFDDLAGREQLRARGKRMDSHTLGERG
jgi:Major intrinsic protein